RECSTEGHGGGDDGISVLGAPSRVFFCKKKFRSPFFFLREAKTGKPFEWPELFPVPILRPVFFENVAADAGVEIVHSLLSPGRLQGKGSFRFVFLFGLRVQFWGHTV